MIPVARIAGWLQVFILIGQSWSWFAPTRTPTTCLGGGYTMKRQASANCDRFLPAQVLSETPRWVSYCTRQSIFLFHDIQRHRANRCFFYLLLHSDEGLKTPSAPTNFRLHVSGLPFTGKESELCSTQSNS